MLAANPAFPVPESPQDLPLFKALSFAESEAVLHRNNVGRLAFALHDRVDVVPIHYVYLNGWLYGRTAPAGKLRDILRNRRIAFEVDEQAALFEWRSVSVHGPLYVIQPNGTKRSRSIYQTALSAIRHLIPEALTDADPAPFRDQIFRIRAAEITGRASLPTGGTRLTAKGSPDALDEPDADRDSKLRELAEMAIAELDLSEPSNIHVDAFDGVLVLSGTVETSGDRYAIETALLKISAVTALVQELETVMPRQQDPFPAELARAALNKLLVPPRVLTSDMKLVVEHGWLRLEGLVRSQVDRDEALRRVRGVKGSRGVISRLRVDSTTSDESTRGTKP